MSRHHVTYKPGGAIGKGLDLTLKMQKKPVEVLAEAVDQGGCESPPLLAIWVDTSGNPIFPVKSDQNVQLIKEFVYCDAVGTQFCIDSLAQSFVAVARMVSEDFISSTQSGIEPPPLWIDESLCSWSWSWAGASHLVIVSGSSIVVTFGYHDGGLYYDSSGVLTITPFYDNVALPPIVLNVKEEISSSCPGVPDY